jgi:hypothetical protein
VEGDPQVGAARVLHRQGGRAAVAVSVGVAGGVPDQQRRRELVQLLAKRQPTVRTRRSLGLCDGTGRSLTLIAPAAMCEPRLRALLPSVSTRVMPVAVVAARGEIQGLSFRVVRTRFQS